MIQIMPAEVASVILDKLEFHRGTHWALQESCICAVYTHAVMLCYICWCFYVVSVVVGIPTNQWACLYHNSCKGFPLGKDNPYYDVMLLHKIAILILQLTMTTFTIQSYHLSEHVVYPNQRGFRQLELKVMDQTHLCTCRVSKLKIGKCFSCWG